MNWSNTRRIPSLRDVLCTVSPVAGTQDEVSTMKVSTLNYMCNAQSFDRDLMKTSGLSSTVTPTESANVQFVSNKNRPSLILIFLYGYGIGGSSKIVSPWIFFIAVLVCAVDQFIYEFTDDGNSTIFRMMVLVNLINAFFALFFTVYNRNRTSQLVVDVFSQLKQEHVPLVKKYEWKTFALLLFLCSCLLTVITALDIVKTEKPSYFLVLQEKKANFIFIITLIPFKVLLTFYIATLYMSCSLHIVTFIGLSLIRIDRLDVLFQLVPCEGHILMKELINMERSFEALEESSSFSFCQMIAMHFVEITLFLYRIITYSSSPNLILISSVCWTFVNTVFVLYSMAIIILFQEKVKKAGRLLTDHIFTHKFSPLEHVFLPVLLEKIKSVTSRSITVWGIVKINRKLILAIYSSFLTVSVLLVQIDNGSLKTSIISANASAVSAVNSCVNCSHCLS